MNLEQLLPTLVFVLLAGLLIGLSIAVVTSRSVFRSAIALTGALAVVGALFALLGADFVAAGQLLIYVGGIMIIMLFVIMLSQRPQAQLDRQFNEQWLWGGLFALAVASGLVVQFRAVYRGVFSTTVSMPTSARLGHLFLGDMVVPFEAVSLVLLAALIGAVYFGLDYEKKP
jgi:NADH:ubiquinone oxidoreductase subunit 6 (subunit J)